MKIAIDATATPQNLVGAGYYVKELVTRLDANESIQLHVVTRKEDLARFQSFAPNSKIHNVSPNNIVGRMSFQSYKLGVFIDSLNVDLFHGPHYQLPIKMKTKSVVTIHDTTLLTHPEVHNKKKAIYFSKMIPFAIKRASAIIAVSKSSAEDINKLYSVNNKVFTCSLGVDEKRFFPYKDGDDNQKQIDIELLKNRGISGEYIGFLGLLEPRKSIPTLINAFSKIAQDFPDLKLVLAGSPGWGMDEIRESIINSNVATRIILPGRLGENETGPYLRCSKVFVYPSLYEGFGLPVLEAMACGVPTITTNSSSLKEVAGTGIDAGALLFKPKDEKKLKDLLVSILSDEKSQEDYSSKAIKRASKFSWNKCVEEHIDVYSSLATS